MSIGNASPALIRAYLINIQSALVNQQETHAELLLQHALELLPPEQSDTRELPPSPLQLSIGVGLHPGKRRQFEPNEDYTFAVSGVLPGAGEHFGLFVVADGMGGHAKGQDASRLATHVIVDYVLPVLYSKQRGAELASGLLREAVQRANACLYAMNEEAPSALQRMGTTLTAALVIDTELVVANVGDSRTYLSRSGSGLRAVTRDHSVVAELAARGAITAEEVYTHPERNKILRSVGTDETVEVDTFSEQLQEGDTLLCCSDGMWEMTRDPKIQEILQDPQLSPEQIAERLVLLALQGGGLDNIGLVVVQASVVDIAVLSTMIFPTHLALLPS